MKPSVEPADPYLRGQLDAESGKKLPDCPYSIPKHRRKWQAGWKDWKGFNQ